LASSGIREQLLTAQQGCSTIFAKGHASLAFVNTVSTTLRSFALTGNPNAVVLELMQQRYLINMAKMK